MRIQKHRFHSSLIFFEKLNDEILKNFKQPTFWTKLFQRFPIINSNLLRFFNFLNRNFSRYTKHLLLQAILKKKLFNKFDEFQQQRFFNQLLRSLEQKCQTNLNKHVPIFFIGIRQETRALAAQFSIGLLFEILEFSILHSITVCNVLVILKIHKINTAAKLTRVTSQIHQYKHRICTHVVDEIWDFAHIIQFLFSFQRKSDKKLSTRKSTSLLFFSDFWFL